ncbi:hypothetical protein DM860_015974 [Cuscuta australis]|uniref:Transmembrane protein n=1 Tax=Cuscuta australis TaxID=267555 RepID=A0A328DYS6_9ASTE|nr:hypothetical protein DM860_015974 [Cuscuta australis]
MSSSLLHQTSLTTLLASSSFKPQRRTLSCNFATPAKISASPNPDDGGDDGERPFRKSENKLAKLAVVALAAGVLTMASVDPASAAKSGGRVGGQSFRSSPSAPGASAPRINNSRTNVYINPPVAPPLVGGYGYSMPFYGGGWGWSPFSFFAPGPSVAIGVGGGFDTLALFVFIGAGAAVVRRLLGGSRGENDDDDY